MNKELEEKILDICIKIGKRGEGAIFVVGDVKYSPLVSQDVPPFLITENPKLLESLALMDGAVIIREDGYMKAYGVKLEVGNIIMRNFGTRHASALNASMVKGNTAFTVSEEDRKVRIFQEGKMMLEIDSLTKNVEKNISEMSKIMESVGYGTLGVIGAGVLAPAIGVVAIPGITIFVVTTGVTYFLKKAREEKIIK